MHRQTHWLAISLLIGGFPPPAATAQAASASLTREERVALEMPAPNTLAPFRAGDRFFHVDGSGALLVQDGEHGAVRALLPAGSFGVLAPSPNGRYLAYTLGPLHAGSYDIRIRDVQTGRDLPDALHSSRISPAPWSHDNKGFLFVREDSAGGRQRVYYHGLGRDLSKDPIILSQFDHPEWRYAARVSDDGNYAIFTISYPADAHTRIYFIDLADPGKPNFGAPVVKLSQSFDARYEFIDNAGSYFFLQTDRDAPRGRIVLANTDVIRESRWPSLIPEAADTLLFARTAGNEFLVAAYRSGSAAESARVYGPQDPNVLRQEMHDRLDSLKKARKKAGEDAPRAQMGSRVLMGNGPAIRLEPRTDIPIPPGASIVAMNSLADQEQLFYTLKLSDGRLQSFTYNVREGRNTPYTPATPPAR